MSSPRRDGPVLCVVGARPNFIKMDPILRAFDRRPDAGRAVLVHTGQHYDAAMNDRLFEDLGLRSPEVNLGVGSGSHAVQTAEVLRRFEPLIDQFGPSCVLVVGDVNSTLACSLAAAKRQVAVAHVEAGLRSFDRAMPEEINRILTDQLSDLLFTTERSAEGNLAREGIPSERIRFVGNVMIDSLRANLPRAPKPADILRAAGADATAVSGRYGVVTLHRPSNVDSAAALGESLEILRAATDVMPLVCALHPRTRQNVTRFGLDAALASPRIVVLPPLGYLDMLGLMAGAAAVLTDSGGLQEETTALGVPCLTLRENTERPITVEQGTNTVVGRDRPRVLALLREIAEGGGKRGRVPELWDGHSADRIAAAIADWRRAA